jgi:short-subunit dehydrogenase
MALPAPSPDTTVLVTGATAGIGRAIAQELAARGYGLTLVSRTREDLDELAAALDVPTHVHACDLARDRSRRTLLRDLTSGPDIVGLCNNAGTAQFGAVVTHDLEDEDELVRLNVLAMHELTTRLVRPMVERGAGAVLNLASIVAFAPQPQMATYGATKAFIASWSEALHTELSGSGVSCTSVNPGPTRTGIWAKSGEPNASGFGPSVVWQDPEDVARAAVDGMVRGRRAVTPKWTNKLAVLGYRAAPRTTLLPAMEVAQSESVRRFLLGDRS